MSALQSAREEVSGTPANIRGVHAPCRVSGLCTDFRVFDDVSISSYRCTYTCPTQNAYVVARGSGTRFCYFRPYVMWQLSTAVTASFIAGGARRRGRPRRVRKRQCGEGCSLPFVRCGSLLKYCGASQHCILVLKIRLIAS